MRSHDPRRCNAAKSHDYGGTSKTHQHLLCESTCFLEEVEIGGGGVALQVHLAPPMSPAPSLVGEDHVVELVDAGQLQGADGGGGQGV